MVGCSSRTTGDEHTGHNSTPATAGSTTGSPSSATGSAPFPTLTVPSLQPPKQQNRNRPDVTFDPCTWIDDGTLLAAGFSPDSRKRHPTADIHAEYTFLSCQFASPDKVYGLSILSGNMTMEEGRAKFVAEGAEIEDSTVDGRAAMVVRPKSADFCSLLLQTKVGYVQFSRDTAGYLINGPKPERCAGIVDLVRMIIPRIGDN